jgi:hypothetical protein
VRHTIALLLLPSGSTNPNDCTEGTFSFHQECPAPPENAGRSGLTPKESHG